MPILLREPALEDRLTEQCAYSPFRTSKGPVSVFLLQHVLDAADAEDMNVFAFVDRLARRAKRLRKRAGARPGHHHREQR